jgi:hypothetical protein
MKLDWTQKLQITFFSAAGFICLGVVVNQLYHRSWVIAFIMFVMTLITFLQVFVIIRTIRDGY